ncbi:Putative GTP cyclohydrolase [Xanthoria parietina]
MEIPHDVINQILRTVESVQDGQKQLAEDVLSIKGRLELLALQQDHSEKEEDIGTTKNVSNTNKQSPDRLLPASAPINASSLPGSRQVSFNDKPAPPQRSAATSLSSRIILTTYPGQAGIDPIAMSWGHYDQMQRGPVVVSRSQSTIKRRNAIGAHGGSYSVYHALAVASKNLDVDHRADFTNSEPAVNLGPFAQWADAKKIVSLDPWGHLSPWLFDSMIKTENIHIRPTIAITKAHMKLPELEQSVRLGRLRPDGKICLNDTGELAVTKFAVEPVWFLPGVAERFGIDEGSLRRSLFENTGGSYPELITRGDMKLFLPPIGGLTVYCFGDPSKMSDPNVKLALRIHDECNGSDVFGSDICTCRPYLIFGVEEAVKEAQRGGSGVVVYFRKEGRALGEVTKYLVYNARKRGTDRASDYFQRTESIAGVKDMRFQALMPDILHWLGITKIDRMLSMSNMKYDAIVEQGIPILERIPIPDELIPEDSRVEIDAKIHAGYFTTGKVMNLEELAEVRGRAWEDVDH